MTFVCKIRVELFVLMALAFCVFGSGVSGAAEVFPSHITLNQVGYPQSGHKIAMVNTDSDVFTVCKADSGDVVFEGELGEPAYWLFSAEWIKVADFSDLTVPGRYYVEAEGKRSCEFEISDSVYDELCISALKYFYYNRVSTALDKKYAGKWHRKAGHLDDEVMVHSSAVSKGRPAGTIISSPKGWYDAGDYNKYVVNAGITTYTLMALHEAYPDYMKSLTTGIPESGNAVPDVLDEALWGIEWLLTMQDPSDGGVYHKLTNKGFHGPMMPHEANADRYVVRKSTSATLNFAAVMAQASRVYSEYEDEFPGLSEKCLKQAVRAWQWAKNNPKIYYTVKQPKGIITGAYDDKQLKDEFCWAAVELYIATDDNKYYWQSNIRSIPMRTATWRNVAGLAFISLIHNEDTLTPAANIDLVKKKFMSYANYQYNRYSDCEYKITNERFEWGSNGLCANDAIVEMVAYELTGDRKFLEVGQANLSYLLGRNPLNKCYVTGFGSNSPKNVHHMVSSADDVVEPIPGMLVGGPNHQNTSDCGTEKYPTVSQPAKSYVDLKCSYSTNEVAINWNAALSYLVCAINANVQEDKEAVIRVSTGGPARISIDGNKFVTLDGKQIMFKGVALPDPVRLDADGHWNAKYFDEIKAWNANLVRLPVSPKSWREIGQDKFFELIDRAIFLCKQRDIYIVIDWHSMGNLYEEVFQGESRKTTKEETLEFWAAVAKRYSGENTIAFYETFNEPTTFFGKLGEMTWDQWRDIVKRIVGEIRKYDTETIPVVAGLNWAYDLTEVKDKPFDVENVAYSIHPYPMKSKEPWEENWEKTWGYVADEYPMIALEFGYNLEDEEGAHVPTIGTEEFGKRIINYFTKKGISWAVWCFDWQWQPALLKGDSYEATDTQGAFFKKVLQENISHFEISPAKPNIVFFIADDMYPDMFNCLPEGRGKNLTPNIDRLASEGVVMMGQHVVSPVCTPSRYNCLTGRYASRATNGWFLQTTKKNAGQTVVEFNTHITEKDVTLPKLLKGDGYKTGMVGKNHVVEVYDLHKFPDFHADAKSPEIVAKLKENSEKIKREIGKAGFDYVANVYHNNPDFIGLGELAVQNMDWIAKGGLDFVDQNHDQPFFLYFATTIPHEPAGASRSWNANPLITADGYLDEPLDVLPSRKSIPERIKKAGLARQDKENLLWLDDSLGALMKKLEQHDILDNTIIFFFSDHGQNAKGTVYQGGVHDPSIIWKKGGFKCGSISEAQVSNVDFAPTILDYAGVDYSGVNFDGISFKPVLDGEINKTRESLYFELGYARGVLKGKWKYVAIRYPEHIENMSMDEKKRVLDEYNAGRRRKDLNIVSTDPSDPFSHLTAIPGGGDAEYGSTGKYAGYYDRDQLYDLSNDPGEQNNLAGKWRYKKQLAEMKSELKKYIDDLPGTFPVDN